MSKKTRRKFTVEQKTAILRRHLADKVPVSDLCDEYKLQPSVFYSWQRQLFENMASAIAVEGDRRESSKREQQLARRVVALEARLAKKDTVIAYISEEHIALKKELGEL